jgi:hypothetical protein
VTDGRDTERPVTGHGPLRRFLKLLVEADSSRFLLSRIKAMLLLIALLGLFAALGYGLPSWLSRYF